MVDDKIVRFPINSSQRWRNRHGKFAVSCLVTDRYLQFDTKSSSVGDGDYVFLNVMTENEDKKSRKLCMLCVSKQDLRAVLDMID